MYSKWKCTIAPTLLFFWLNVGHFSGMAKGIFNFFSKILLPCRNLLCQNIYKSIGFRRKHSSEVHTVFLEFNLELLETQFYNSDRNFWAWVD